MSDDQTESPRTAQREMPAYRSHKTVWALKIKAIEQAPADQERCHLGGDWYIVPEDAGYAPVMVGHDYIVRHAPEPGGYYVVYADGYKSFSPAKSFEDGYTRIGATGLRVPSAAANFRMALEQMLNRHSRENESNTPDWVLAAFLNSCLLTFEGAVRERDKWYGISPRPGAG